MTEREEAGKVTAEAWWRVRGPGTSLRWDDAEGTVKAAWAAAELAARTSGELFEAVQKGLAELGVAMAVCPINSKPGHGPDVCPKCGATSSQNCGPSVTAHDKFEASIRETIAKLEAQRT